MLFKDAVGSYWWSRYRENTIIERFIYTPVTRSFPTLKARILAAITEHLDDDELDEEEWNDEEWDEEK